MLLFYNSYDNNYTNLYICQKLMFDMYINIFKVRHNKLNTVSIF